MRGRSGREQGGERSLRDSQREVVIAALGDSITAGSPAWDPEPAVRAAITAPDERSQYEYWAARVDPRRRFRNCGVYGERTDQIAARLGQCARGSDVLLIQGGINDIAQGLPVERAAEKLHDLLRRGLQLVGAAALADVLPWNNGYPDAHGPIGHLNELIHGIGRREGVPVLPFHDTLEDPTRPGRMRADWTSDGDHPSIEGYRRLGELAFRLP